MWPFCCQNKLNFTNVKNLNAAPVANLPRRGCKFGFRIWKSCNKEITKVIYVVNKWKLSAVVRIFNPVWKMVRSLMDHGQIVSQRSVEKGEESMQESWKGRRGLNLEKVEVFKQCFRAVIWLLHSHFQTPTLHLTNTSETKVAIKVLAALQVL